MYAYSQQEGKKDVDRMKRKSLTKQGVHTDHIKVTHLFQGKNLTERLGRWHLTFNILEPTLKYLPGKANTAANALSRNISDAAVTEIVNFSSPELRKVQRQDSLRSKVIYTFESDDDSTLPRKPVPLSAFTLNEDVLYRRGTVAKAKVTQFVIPSSLIERLKVAARFSFSRPAWSQQNLMHGPR